MLKKILITASFIALSSALSSCSYINKKMSSSEPRSSYENNEEVSAAPTETIVHHHHGRHGHHHHHVVQNGMPTTTIVSEDGLKETTCTEITYTSTADKVQTLGYLPAGTPISQKVVAPVVHHKKAAPKAKKAKVVKKDSYNAPAAPAAEPEPAASIEQTNNVNPVEIPNSTPEPVAPKPTAAAPASSTPPAVTMPAPTSVTPPAPAQVTPPVTPPATIPTPPAQVTPPVTVPAPAATPTMQPSAAVSNPTATPMANEQVPAAASNTVSIGRLATLDYSESQVDIPSSSNSTLDQIAMDLKQNPGKNVKIQSYAFSKDGNATEARRNSLQRAIKVRKYLIDKDVSASRISVNAIEDINNKLNKVEISFEEAKQ